jgi:hypothetical protein
LLAVLAPAGIIAQEPPPTFRSLNDVRPRPVDEHDRPYFRETQSHRGFEVRDEKFTVIATTSRDDARWAAGQVATAWQNAAGLADAWMTSHRNPDFGLQTLQVVIDDEPLRDRDAPLTTVNVVGIRTQVYVNVAPGQPPLAQQLVRLREGAAFAFLHTAGVDSAAPPWVVEGIAGFAARQRLSEQEIQAGSAGDQAAQFGGQQWRFARATEDTLAQPADGANEARQRVTFLLVGDDAAHAPRFLGAIGAAVQATQLAAAEGVGYREFGGQPRLPSGHTTFDQLARELQPRFERWKQEPLAGQPIFKPAEGAPDDVVTAQQRMLIALKLQKRFGQPEAQTRVRTKIVMFDKAKGMVTERPAAAASTVSVQTLVSRLLDPAQPAWATLDARGGILLSQQTERVRELLGNREARYTLARELDRVVLVERLDPYRTLRGWLEENPENPLRPLARFEVVDARRKPG